MSLDPARLLQAARGRGPFVRVIVAAVSGSAPRETGAEMLVWPDACLGTIGGGQLEFEAIATARRLRTPKLECIALGPALGQCCGGAVVLAYEPLDVQAIEKMQVSAGGAALHLRCLGDAAAAETPPLALRRALAMARSQGHRPPLLIGQWLVEPITPPAPELWIWGAGHVGRALVGVLAPLADWRLVWVDTAAARFPEPIAEGVTRHIAPHPASLVAQAESQAQHLVATFSHALDLELCHQILRHGFGGLGLIGSASKWARFRHRLRDLGHDGAQISRIACPIGDPSLGKAPQAIAISVAAALLKEKSATRAATADKQEGRAG